MDTGRTTEYYGLGLAFDVLGHGDGVLVEGAECGTPAVNRGGRLEVDWFSRFCKHQESQGAGRAVL